MREISKLVLKLDFTAFGEPKRIEYMDDFGENMFGGWR
jgi:hypothetical protein